MTDEVKLEGAKGWLVVLPAETLEELKLLGVNLDSAIESPTLQVIDVAIDVEVK